MKRNAFTLVQMAIVLIILAGLTAVLFPIFFNSRGTGTPRSTCLSQIKQISLGIKQYIQDYDEKYPLISSKHGGWMDNIQPYLKSTLIFQCPPNAETMGIVDGTNDYFYNSRLSGQAEASMDYISSTIMNGDGVPNSPTDAHLAALPLAWKTDKTSPAQRHLEGANYSFADGHVKWLKPDKITTKPATSNNSTFLFESAASPKPPKNP